MIKYYHYISIFIMGESVHEGNSSHLTSLHVYTWTSQSRFPLYSIKSNHVYLAYSSLQIRMNGTLDLYQLWKGARANKSEVGIHTADIYTESNKLHPFEHRIEILQVLENSMYLQNIHPDYRVYTPHLGLDHLLEQRKIFMSLKNLLFSYFKHIFTD